MRAIFGVLGLLLVVAVVGLVARQQLKASSAPLPSVVAPAGGEGAGQGQAAPATPREQVQQFQKSVESAVQAPRPMPDEK